MFKKYILVTLTVILLIGLAGCGSTNQTDSPSSKASDNAQIIPSGTVSDTTDADNYQMLPVISGDSANMKLDASANATTQQLKKGEVMSITLESNPSTGYAWYATISDTTVLVQMGEPEYITPAESTTPIVGAAGQQAFLFQAVESGTTTLTLDYKRAWETDVQPEQTISLTVEVK
jgi:inhibitor of cysteine peptidase